MGKMLIFLLLGFSAIFTVSNLNNKQSNGRMIDNSISYYYENQVKNVAESGLELGISYVRQNPNTATYSSGTIAMAGGNLTYKIADGPGAGIKTVTSTGSFPDPVNSGQTIDHVVSARVQIIPGQNPLIPNQQALRNAITSGGDLHLNSGSKVSVDGGRTDINANIHTNGFLSVETGTSVDGIGTYVSGKDVKQESKTFDPNIDTTNGDLTRKIGAIPLPGFDINELKKNPHVKIAAPGQKQFPLGTKENPVIWYVDGWLSIDNGYKIDGYGGFVVNGGVNFNSGCRVTTPDENLSNIAIFATGDVNLNSGTRIEANIYSKSNVNFNSGCRLYGSVVACGIVINNSGAEVNYRPALGTVTNEVLPDDPNTPPQKPIVALVKGSQGYDVCNK